MKKKLIGLIIIGVFGLCLWFYYFYGSSESIDHANKPPTFAQHRADMVNNIKLYDIRFRDILKKGISPAVLAAMAQVPRHQFISRKFHDEAYRNYPLPIGFGQTISQPYIVALMTQLLQPKPQEKMLEVGSGSGYQAAILSLLVNQVYTIEIIPELAKQVKKRFKKLGYNNIHSKLGDGYYGWPAKSPFDGIIVTAVASDIPPPLIKQLKKGGRMVIPVGNPFSTQYLMLVTKDKNAKVSVKQLMPVRFVPLTGNH